MMADNHEPPAVPDGTIEDIRLWIAAHGATVQERHRVQTTWNGAHERDLRATAKRLDAVERKVVWAAGVAAGAGSVIGFILTTLARKFTG